MNPESLFAVALGITPPWEVEGVDFLKESKRLDIKIGFRRGDANWFLIEKNTGR